MKFELGRYGIRVVPENDLDQAYIEDTLGLRKQGDYVPLVRVNVISMNKLAYVETITKNSITKPLADATNLTQAAKTNEYKHIQCHKNSRCCLPDGHPPAGRSTGGCEFRELTGDSY